MIGFKFPHVAIAKFLKTDNIYLNTKCGLKDPLTSVWYIPHNIKKRLHPTQMPEGVVERILKNVGKEGYFVLDIFCGSGTTCVVAKRNGLDYIGFEINPLYVEVSNKRLYQQKQLSRNNIKVNNWWENDTKDNQTWT